MMYICRIKKLYVVYDNYMLFNLKKNCMSYETNYVSFNFLESIICRFRKFICRLILSDV